MLSRTSLALLLPFLFVLAGCQSSETPDPLVDGVNKLKQSTAELATAYKAADIKTVDELFHGELGRVMNQLNTTIQESGLKAEAKESASAAYDEVMDVLQELHPPHGEGATIDPGDFEAEEEKLNSAIDKLAQVAKSL